MEIGLIILAVGIVLAAAILVFARPRAKGPAAAPDPRLDTVLQGQATIAEQFRHSAAAQATMTAQVDALKEKLAESLAANAQKTGETFVSITERLTVIDTAQKNITELSGHVVSLRAIFSDKQARGAISQDQMEAIVAEHLAPDQYEFQAKLSNGKIVDCAIRIPNVAARIVADSKFPHEGFKALREAETEEARKAAMVQVRNDIQKHVKDISERYLIPGETQTPAIMFVPSDSMYAELHASFPESIRRARQSQVVLASPHVFMLVISTLQSLMRDAKMREQADMIRKEVGTMLKDVRMLGERVEKLQRHFNQADGDIKDILISRDKVVGRAEKIEKVEISASEPPEALS
ncbi:MAG TPA: DNA recombination protein RmuC [Rhizomicrobium sp.]|jgi:DNA recombination protein RmuC|nr:DNA recombination protein RmuC [Rhizomicrobium sp.]HWA70040.1 DNA recombination protein RmuC [Rhizomicrobium sp.]